MGTVDIVPTFKYFDIFTSHEVHFLEIELFLGDCRYEFN